MVLLMAVSAAFAGTPTPDRPYVSRTGFLVQENTLEQELGLRFDMLEPAERFVPTTLKYAFGDLVEGRVFANLGAVRAGAPSLQAGAKLKLLRTKQDGLALWLNSGIPVRGEEWIGQIHILFATVLTRTLRLRVNGGLDLESSDASPINYDGTPITAAITYKPVRRVGLFGELAGKAGVPGCGDGPACVYGEVIVQAGARSKVTEHLSADVASGYRFADEQLYVTMGLTANFGRFE